MTTSLKPKKVSLIQIVEDPAILGSNDQFKIKVADDKKRVFSITRDSITLDN